MQGTHINHHLFVERKIGDAPAVPDLRRQWNTVVESKCGDRALDKLTAYMPRINTEAWGLCERSHTRRTMEILNPLAETTAMQCLIHHIPPLLIFSTHLCCASCCPHVPHGHHSRSSPPPYGIYYIRLLPPWCVALPPPFTGKHGVLPHNSLWRRWQ
jgi:hypothetical protein